MTRNLTIMPAALVVAFLLAPPHAAAKTPVPRTISSRQAQEAVEPPEARLVQVFPALRDLPHMTRSRNQERAVLLIHGYWVHFRKEKVHTAGLRDWQEPNSLLVNALSKHSDVFAFSYGQTVPLDEIVALPTLRDGIAALKKRGYSEIVLVGHSAGGLVARQFVEDHPEAGVTKVVQVSAPNGGTSAADFKWVPRCQKPFLASLSTSGRSECLARRTGKKVPTQIQFVCIMTLEDSLVPLQSQWTRDLQEQGIPVVRWPVGHGQIVRKAAAAEKIAEVVRDPQPRWTRDETALAAADIGKIKKAK